MMRRTLALVVTLGTLSFGLGASAAEPTPPGATRYEAVKDLAPFQAMLSTCAKRLEVASPYGDVVKVEQIGVQGATPLFHAHMAKRKRRAIFAGDAVTDDGPCPIYFVGRATAGAYGDYLGDGRRLRAFVIPEHDGTCASKACTAAVIVRDDKKVFHEVGTTGDLVCDSASAKTVKLFSGQDSLELRCDVPLGGGDREQWLLVFHATGRAFEPVLRLPLGVHTAEVGERDDGTSELCERDASGTLRVVSRGATPALEAFVPADDPGDGDGPRGALVRYTWSAAKRRFVKGDAEPHTLARWPEETCTAME